MDKAWQRLEAPALSGNRSEITALLASAASLKSIIEIRLYTESAPKAHVGIYVQDCGRTAYCAFPGTDADGNPTKGTTVWSVGAAGGNHFASSKSTFMVNYQLKDFAALLQALPKWGGKNMT